jgi:outer membrane protein TolC
MGRDFGPMSMNPGGTESFIGMLSLQLPIHRSRPGAQQARIRQQLRGVEQQEVRTINQLRSQLETASEELRSAERDLELLEDELLPRAGQALELLMEAYANAETRFDEVLAMQQELLELQNEHIRILKRQNAAVARLLRLAGAVEN